VVNVRALRKEAEWLARQRHNDNNDNYRGGAGSGNRIRDPRTPMSDIDEENEENYSRDEEHDGSVENDFWQRGY